MSLHRFAPLRPTWTYVCYLSVGLLWVCPRLSNMDFIPVTHMKFCIRFAHLCLIWAICGLPKLMRIFFFARVPISKLCAYRGCQNLLPAHIKTKTNKNKKQSISGIKTCWITIFWENEKKKTRTKTKTKQTNKLIWSKANQTAYNVRFKRGFIIFD